MEATAVSGGTVGKALAVLDAVAASGGAVRFSDLLEESAYPKATLYRFLRLLTDQGMLTFDPERGTYELGVRLVRLAHAAWSQASLAPLARAHLDRLAASTGEVVHLAQLDGGQVLYIDKVAPQPGVEMFSATGRVGPAYCTGVGKAMLAALPASALDAVLPMQSFHAFTEATITDADALRAELGRIRAAGIAFDREEHEPGIVCIAMPVRTRGGRLLGAVSVTSTTGRRGLDALERLAPELAAAARMIETDAHAWRFPDAPPMQVDEPEREGSCQA